MKGATVCRPRASAVDLGKQGLMPQSSSRKRVVSVAVKEFRHIVRDPTTLVLTLFIPFGQMLMLGYAVNTNIRNVRTVVFDQARSQESRSLVREFVNSGDFLIVEEVFTDEALSGAIVAGRARAGIKIHEDFSRRLEAGQTAQVLILVDGSESSVASEVVNVGNAIALRESLKRAVQGMTVEMYPRVLFNPDTRSANFLLPGLLVIVCQVMAVTLSSLSIVREKETGTLEQLFMTPVGSSELILGKMFPYLVITFLEFYFITMLMVLVFRVPIHGAFLTLLGLATPFVLSMLGLGLWISTVVGTRDAATQVSAGTLIPSIFLSGYVFPLDSMSPFFRFVAQLIPTTWMIDAARGVILRGAGWSDLRVHVLVLWVMALASLLLTIFRFRKQAA